MDRRIQPSELREHRQTHHVLGPSCLCPLLEAGLPDCVESTIYLPTSGPWAGLYVATCARERCAYIGKCFVLEFPSPSRVVADLYTVPAVVLENIYPMLGLPIKNYRLRGIFSLNSK
jgi:hypothetical protein